MDIRNSLYLDTVRFLAAIAVVVSHIVYFDIFSESLSAFIPNYGREAVIVFFVLSGYVIAYSTDSKRLSLSEYFIARASRIYSVTLPLLLLAFASVYIASTGTGEMHYQLSRFYIYIPFHSLFLGYMWNLSENPPWLIPYWSLNFEVWYYIFFAGIYFLSGTRRYIFASVILMLMGHKLVLLLPIWLSGLLIYKFRHKELFSTTTARLGWLLSILMIIAFKYFELDISLRAYGREIWPFATLRLGIADRYLCDYTFALIVLLNFFCALRANFAGLIRFKKLIRSCANYTFTLYLIHTLVLSIWEKYYEHDPENIIDVLSIVLLIGASTFVVGQLTEHRKHLFTIGFTQLYKSTLGKHQIDIPNPRQKGEV